jgi:hypothetical protein
MKAIPATTSDLSNMKARYASAVIAGGLLVGLLDIAFALSFAVLPLSAFPYPVSFKPVATFLDLLSHMFLFGLPIALAVRRVAPRGPAI